MKYHSGTSSTTKAMMTPQMSLAFVPDTSTITANTARYTSAVPTSGWATISTSGMPV